MKSTEIQQSPKIIQESSIKSEKPINTLEIGTCRKKLREIEKYSEEFREVTWNTMKSTEIQQNLEIIGLVWNRLKIKLKSQSAFSSLLLALELRA